MSDIEIAGADPGDVVVVEISPGTVLTDDEWAIVAAEAAWGYGLSSDQVLSTPYGYAPMPRPPRPNPDGTGKVWAGVALDVALHPVFWLDDQTRQRGPNETDDVYAIRLFLALADRAMIDPETQQPENPFVAQGIDSDHPHVRDDLADYLRGEPVGWLCKFAIPTPREASRPSEVVAMAAQLADKHRGDYHDLKVRSKVRADAVFRDVATQLASADIHADARELLAAGEHLRANPADRAARAATERAVHTLLDRVDHLDNCRETVVRAVEYAVNGRPGRPVAAAHAALEEASTQRRDVAERALAAVTVRADHDTLRALWQSLSGPYAAIVDSGRRAATDATTPR